MTHTVASARRLGVDHGAHFVLCVILGGRALNQGACDWLSSSHATLGHCTGTTLFLQLFGA
eukprot:3752746-Amphidinium_carterae.1